MITNHESRRRDSTDSSQGDGFVDLQVNGYAGVDFNAHELSEANLLKACRQMNDDGVAKFMPTIITDDLQSMVGRIARLTELADANPEIAEMVAGIHVEGPFISPVEGFVGAHPVRHVRNANIDDAKKLVDAGGGRVRLFTLAPEVTGSPQVIRWLADQSVVVAAGHSDASLSELKTAIDCGLSLYTHLGNGCSASVHRHDNIIQRVLSLGDQMSVSFIADGHHVPWFALGNYLRTIPEANIIIVTDAISAAGLGPGFHRLGDQVVEVDQNLAAWAEGHKHFAGCATTMPQMAELLSDHLGCSAAQIRRWTGENPMRLIDSTSR